MNTINIIAFIALAILSFLTPILPAIVTKEVENKYRHLYIIVLTTKNNVKIDIINKYFKTKEDAIIYAYDKNYKNYYITMVSRDI